MVSNIICTPKCDEHPRDQKEGFAGTSPTKLQILIGEENRVQFYSQCRTKLRLGWAGARKTWFRFLSGVARGTLKGLTGPDRLISTNITGAPVWHN